MTVALLATGDEIIHGDTLNTNSHHIAQILSSEGLSLGLQLVCSDKESELCDSLQFLTRQHDIIIIIGGLGPTSDDRTRFALARFLGVDLVVFPQAIEHIQKRLKFSGIELSAGNRQQAFFPAGATLLPNPRGSAVGCYYSWKDKIFVLLPGPPTECLPMFNDFVLPLLQQGLHSDKQLLKWRVFGVAESQIAQIIDDALKGIDCKTGYRLDTPYVECKISCRKDLVEPVRQLIDPLLAPYIIATPQQKASQALYESLVKTQVPIAIIDEVTGGVLQSLIQHPDSYAWVKFYPDKKASLHFHLCGLTEFWVKGKTTAEGTGRTQLSIEYRNLSSKGNESYETHEIPYRSPLVVHYAAELISFRLFHLINQLHQ